MKTKFYLLACAVFIVSLLTQTVHGQWTTNVSSSSDFFEELQLGTGVQSVGIGDFGANGAAPLSALHINTKSAYLTPSAFAFYLNQGEVFRTESPAGLAAWRMFTANSADNEKFNINNPNGNSHINIHTVQGGNLNFNFGNPNFGTNFPATQMTILGRGTATPGYVGIGTLFNPMTSTLPKFYRVPP